jgi:uncharacterized cupredoxin-like copper-binding protein
VGTSTFHGKERLAMLRSLCCVFLVAAFALAGQTVASVNPKTQSTEPVTEIDLSLADIFFEPEELTIPADTDVTVHLSNDGASLHSFNVDDLGIHEEVAPGETTDVVINAPPGEYEFYCDIPGHAAAGMVGTLIVQGEATSTGTEGPEAGEDSTAPVVIELQDIRFVPPDLSVPANKPTTITLENTGAAPHNFSIDELGIDEDLDPGESKEVEINAAAGHYKYYCNVPGHEAAGMVGTLTVEGPQAHVPTSTPTSTPPVVNELENRVAELETRVAALETAVAQETETPSE